MDTPQLAAIGFLHLAQYQISSKMDAFTGFYKKGVQIELLKSRRLMAFRRQTSQSICRESSVNLPIISFSIE
jgi:hypothetical protein